MTQATWRLVHDNNVGRSQGSPEFQSLHPLEVTRATRHWFRNHPDTEHDSRCLQGDLDVILQWTEIWQMKLNIDKCLIIRCTRSSHLIEFAYKLNEIILKTAHQHQYLGITLDKSMHWSYHIQALCKKANKTLNFIWRNLNKCDKSIKQVLTSPLWDLYWNMHHVFGTPSKNIWFVT